MNMSPGNWRSSGRCSWLVRVGVWSCQ